jgi:hypothetical protein
MISQYIIIKHAGMENPLVSSSFLLHSNVAGKSRGNSDGICESNAMVSGSDGFEQA